MRKFPRWRPAAALLALICSVGALIPPGAQAAQGAQAAAPLVAPRIVGGTPTTINVVPWQVLLIAGGKLCGGSIISSTWILTAAHCVYGLNPAQVSVYSGISNNSQRASVAPIGAGSIAVHPGFAPPSYGNDIALISLNSPIVTGPNAQVVALPIAQDPATWPPVGTEATISGWGVTSFNAPSTNDQLLKATVQVLAPPTAACGEYGTGFDGFLSLCAGFQAGGVDTCQGDSGGPLVINVGGVPLLAGVTSVGFECARANFPGIYSRTSTFIPWIRGFVDIPVTAPIPPADVQVAAVAGAQAVVSWTASVNNGGAAVASYTALAAPGGAMCTTAEVTCAVTGLVPGKTYAFTVSASNSIGPGQASVASAPVVAVSGTSTVGRTVKAKTVVKWADLKYSSGAKLSTSTAKICKVAKSGVLMRAAGTCVIAVRSGGKRGTAFIGAL